ncbi:MAG TPA: diaminopimelate epimerase [Chitinophagaceae bacterium]|nr:diaminopimelate epimerase [Chitinophagaceae bacterium]
MKLEFYKYQGTGNDFILLDNRHRVCNLTARQVNFLCHRRFGIGADGLMLLNEKPGYDFEMTYYNSDGNTSSMCGNGGRCILKFASMLGIKKSKYHFYAIDGAHEGEIDLNGDVRLKMKDVHEVEFENMHFVLNTGSPHYVKNVSDARKIDVVAEGREIRYSKEFSEEGINVNFVETIDDDTIYVRTYERGVEDETYSCGTGVTAAALISAHNDNGFNRVEVQTLGGRLSVEYEKMGEQEFRNIWLCGPAELVFKGEIEINI